MIISPVALVIPVRTAYPFPLFSLSLIYLMRISECDFITCATFSSV